MYTISQKFSTYKIRVQGTVFDKSSSDGFSQNFPSLTNKMIFFAHSYKSSYNKKINKLYAYK